RVGGADSPSSDLDAIDSLGRVRVGHLERDRYESGAVGRRDRAAETIGSAARAVYPSAAARAGRLILLDPPDHGLGEPHPLVEAGLVRQESVAVGIQQLHHLERLTRVP